MSRPQTQFRNFIIRLSTNDREKVHYFAVQFNHYAYILHDKDIFQDNTESHNAGDKKADHFHLLINSKDKFSKKQIIELCHKYIPHANESVSIMDNAKGGADYLTHETEKAIKENKHRYERSEIISDNIQFWYEKEVQQQIREDKEDWTKKLFMAYEENVLNNDYFELPATVIKDFVKKYGRDFIFNFSKVRDFALFYASCMRRDDERARAEVEHKMRLEALLEETDDEQPIFNAVNLSIPP